MTSQAKPYPAVADLSIARVSDAAGRLSQNCRHNPMTPEKRWPVAARDIRIGASPVQPIDTARVLILEIHPFPSL
jgi:hypothetical protein